MTNCPRCDQRGRKISALTLSSHVLPERLTEIEGYENWTLCLAATCPVIYFREKDMVGPSEVKTLPFHKHTSPDRIVCFCFDHRADSIREEILSQGSSTAQASIKAACKLGKDDCERKNPQGRCCLGNVGIVIKDAQDLEPESNQKICCD